MKQQQFDKAKPLTDQALKLSRRLPIENSLISARGLSALGWDYLEQGQVAQADTLCEVALQALANPIIITQMGAVRLAQQRYAEAGATDAEIVEAAMVAAARRAGAAVTHATHALPG